MYSRVYTENLPNSSAINPSVKVVEIKQKMDGEEKQDTDTVKRRNTVKDTVVAPVKETVKHGEQEIEDLFKEFETKKEEKDRKTQTMVEMDRKASGLPEPPKTCCGRCCFACVKCLEDKREITKKEIQAPEWITKVLNYFFLGLGIVLFLAVVGCVIFNVGMLLLILIYHSSSFLLWQANFCKFNTTFLKTKFDNAIKLIHYE